MFSTLTKAPRVRFKIAGMISESEYNRLPFGRQIEYRKRISEFQQRATVVHVSIKRRAFSTALRESIKLYNAAEWYVVPFNDSQFCRDDSFAFHYVPNATEPEPQPAGGVS